MQENGHMLYLRNKYEFYCLLFQSWTTGISTKTPHYHSSQHGSITLVQQCVLMCAHGESRVVAVKG